MAEPLSDEVVLAAVLVTLNLTLFFIFTRAVKVVRQAEVMIIERFGRFKSVLKPGLHLLVPLVEIPRKIHWRYLDVKPGQTSPSIANKEMERIDMREHVLDFGKQTVITKDTVAMDIDALVYYQIADPRLAVYKIQNLPTAIELLVQTTLRNLIAHVTLDESFSSRETLNNQLLSVVATDAQRWGVSIVRVEVVSIDPPGDIKRAMEEQIRCSRDRRASVLQADGDKESSIIQSRGACAQTVLKAEGVRTCTIQKAKGDAQAKLMKAKAEADCVLLLREAIQGSGFTSRRAVDYLVAVQYLSSLRSLTSSSQPSEVILIPREIVDGLGAITDIRAGLKA